MLVLAMQVRVMAASMQSQIDKQEYTASAQSRGREADSWYQLPTVRCLWGREADSWYQLPTVRCLCNYVSGTALKAFSH